MNSNKSCVNTKPEIRKRYINSQELLIDSYKLAKKILDDPTFSPTWILALWRGGCFVGSAVQEYLTVHGVKCDHIAVRTSHYSKMDQLNKIRVHGLQYVLNTCKSIDRLLIVDDVFDTGRSCEKILQEIKGKMRKNCPCVIKIAVVCHKTKRNLTQIIPDYVINEISDEWIVFPHELEGLTLSEIEKKEGLMGKEISKLLIHEKLVIHKNGEKRKHGKHVTVEEEEEQ